MDGPPAGAFGRLAGGGLGSRLPVARLFSIRLLGGIGLCGIRLSRAWLGSIGLGGIGSLCFRIGDGLTRMGTGRFFLPGLLQCDLFLNCLLLACGFVIGLVLIGWFAAGGPCRVCPVGG